MACCQKERKKKERKKKERKKKETRKIQKPAGAPAG